MIKLNDDFIAPRQAINREKTIPYALKRCHETGRFDAFKLQWRDGMPNRPHMFWDSDVAKVLEGLALNLAVNPDAEQERELERWVELIVGAQQGDGYLNTYFTVVEPGQRWKDLYSGHELYCAGHLLEAAIAHFRGSGKTHFLDAMERYVDHIAMVFGKGKGQIAGYPGHQEIELALLKLYQLRGNPKHLELARYFLEERGRDPHFFLQEKSGRHPDGVRLRQAHLPVRRQHEAVGHAVRALYMYCAMAELAALSGDTELLRCCEDIFSDIVRGKMYITGGVGSTPMGEAFTRRWNLPGDTAYAESCAAMAMTHFAAIMYRIKREAQYRDVLERILFNALPAGISLDGTEFFYANLLSVGPDTHEHGDVCFKTRRPWFGCSCCPTNYCRIWPQVGDFCYLAEADALDIVIPLAAEIVTEKYEVEVCGRYPHEGAITVEIRRAENLRITFRSEKFVVNSGDKLEFTLDMSVRLVRAHANVSGNRGRVAVFRGPLVYALESTDNSDMVPGNMILTGREWTMASERIGTFDFYAVSVDGLREQIPNSGDALYFTGEPEYQRRRLKFIPMALWQNRGAANMEIFVRTHNGC